MVTRTHVNFTLYIHCHLCYCYWIDLLSNKLTSTPVNMCVYAYRSAEIPEHRDWQITQTYCLITPRLTSSRPTSTRAHIFGPQANRPNSKVQCWSYLWISEIASSDVTGRISCWFSASKFSLNKLRKLMNLSVNLRTDHHDFITLRSLDSLKLTSVYLRTLIRTSSEQQQLDE